MMKCKKRYITLLEIMIVIFLIGIIGSVIGYNMKGSIDKGKVFRTQESIKQVHDILLLEIAEGASIDKQDNDGMTPLHRAAFQNAIQSCKFLIENGAEIDHNAVDGSTALMVAMENNNTEVCKLLEKKR